MSVRELNKRMNYLVEKGYDKTHRLYREIQSKHFWRLAKALV